MSKPAEGERRAASGYRAQYLVGAAAVLDALDRGDLAWIRVADLEAGRVDDLQIGTTARVDAYQVKWEQYGGTTTLRDLVHGTGENPSLIAQLADGWRRLQQAYAHHRVVVHLRTNAIPSSSTSAAMPETEPKPRPYHFAAFVDQAWRPAQHWEKYSQRKEWSAVWESIRTASCLSVSEFSTFVPNCSLDFQTVLPEVDEDVLAMYDLLFATAASPEGIIELSCDELLRRLGWEHRYAYRSRHEFPAPPFLYRPIRNTVDAFRTTLESLPKGYIGVFGPPGSGKSTLLSRALRSFPVRLVPYYAYVPEAQDPSILRGESLNFLHDVTLRLREAGFGVGKRPDPSDRALMVELLHEQLQALGEDYLETGTKTVVLVDGLDHIAREQHPERSLLCDLPLPATIPDGVYMVVGSQTDALADLPPQVHHALKEKDRRIDMGRLTPVDVYAIVEGAAPHLVAAERQRVFELTGGHPLALIYLLKQLRLAKHQQERTELMEQAEPYQGDIEAQYWGHWRAIEDDDRLVHALGLLSRVRGPIPMKWVATWLETPTLRKLQRLFVPYFEEQTGDRWIFFHNSFRLFLIERTAEALPGKSPAQRNLDYHHELAERYEAATAPWQWETLYHRYSSEEYASVVTLATQEWFKEQVEALRPLDAIQTDARLALKAAGMCKDVVALARLTLVGAALEQRAWILEDRALPDLLLEAGEAVRAAEHLRDGNRLRVDAEQALRLATRLYEAGLKSEGRRAFELAEPLEFLSGRPIPDDHTRPRNLRGLLREWVRSAIVFRGVEETVRVIQRIRTKPGRLRSEEESTEEASLRLQNGLYIQGALSCSEREDWDSWKVLFDALNEKGDRADRMVTLLRSARNAHEMGNATRADELLHEILAMSQPDDLETINGKRWQIELGLSVAELALYAGDNKQAAQTWLSHLSPIPLEDKGSYLDSSPSLHELRFRWARARYFLGETHTPETLRNEAEAHTEFSEHIKEGDRLGRCQVALAVLYLARLWAWGRQGSTLKPTSFLQEIRWILDLFGLGWSDLLSRSRLGVAGANAEILRFAVIAAAEHGSEVVSALKDEFGVRWTDSHEASAWGLGLQRQLVGALVEANVDQAWAKAQLHRIEPLMLHGHDPYGCVEECESQAKTWLALGEHEIALAELSRMMGAARGILGDKDYQLPEWVKWLGRANELEPHRSEERICLMLRRILGVQHSASGVVDAAEELLRIAFQWSPRRAVRLLKGLLEDDIIGHQGGVASILQEALNAQDPPAIEVLHSITDLMLPLTTSSDPDLVEALIVRASERLGRDSAIEMAQYLAERIGVDAPGECRSGWYEGIAAGFIRIDAALSQAGLQPSDLERRTMYSSSQIDESFHLKGGEHLELTEVLGRAQTPEALRALIEAEDREQTGYFDWAAVIEGLASRVYSVPEIKDIEGIIETRLASNPLSKNQLAQSLVALSRRCLELSGGQKAWALVERALDMTEASGWDPRFDGGVRHAALRQMIAIDREQSQDSVIDLYTQDLSERFRAPDRMALHLYDILKLLSDDIPIVEVWHAIEIHLDELFASALVEPQPMVETALQEPVGTLEDDTPARAIADLLGLYLDHPSYSVAQAAVRACTAALLDGSEKVAAAICEALAGTDQSTERALMALDGASLENPSVAVPFTEILTELCLSPNLTIRLLATETHARACDDTPTLVRLGRDLSAIYTLHLPEIALYRTEEVVRGTDSPVLMDDPARLLSPFDIEARVLAGEAGLPEENVLYQMAQYFQKLQPERTWLAENEALDPKRLSLFLDGVGLRHDHYKPHIVPARQSLAYVAAELFDGGYISPAVLRLLSGVLVHHDPAFVRWRPDKRPSCIVHMGDIPAESYSYTRLPTNWVETAGNSLSLLSTHTSDGRVIVGERTRLKHLQDEWPTEERMAMVRAVHEDELWDGLEVESGHLPFFRCQRVQVADYPSLRAPEDHLLVVHDGFDIETPGASWLALNPAVGQELGWQPINDGWFRWADQKGNIVVESVWWGDGPLHQCSERLHGEVGGGWLVLMTELGLKEVLQRFGHLTRGGVTWRSKGWHGDADRCHAKGVLPL
jgi:hypothetical protein